MAAFESPGWCQQARAVEPQLAFLGTVDPPQPHAAAKATGAARAVNQLVMQHRQRILDFERLDRQVRGVGHMDMDAIQPVFAARAPEPPPIVSRSTQRCPSWGSMPAKLAVV